MRSRNHVTEHADCLTLLAVMLVQLLLRSRHFLHERRAACKRGVRVTILLTSILWPRRASRVLLKLHTSDISYASAWRSLEALDDPTFMRLKKTLTLSRHCLP